MLKWWRWSSKKKKNLKKFKVELEGGLLPFATAVLLISDLLDLLPTKRKERGKSKPKNF
jgi:hypothetical protein